MTYSEAPFGRPLERVAGRHGPYLAPSSPGVYAIASREVLSRRAVRLTLSLAHVSPSIVRAIVADRLPRGIAIRDLVDLPPSWSEQEQALGLA